jgi:hypothetical protein
MSNGVRLRVHMPSYQFSYDKKQIRKVMRSAGTEVAQVARKMVSSAVGAGRVYYGPGGSTEYRTGAKGGRYQASAAGSAPVRVSGTLARSLKVQVFKSGEGVSIRDSAFYALFLEAGAQGGVASGQKGVKGQRNVRQRRGGVNQLVSVTGVRQLQPRPFLTAALETREASIATRIAASLKDDIAFVRIKA